MFQGKPSLAAVVAAEGSTRDEVLRQAAALQKSSSHPLAVAVMDQVRHERLPLPEAHDAQALPGRGVQGVVRGHTLALGITLMRGDPRLVADSLDISRRTYSKIKQGLFWAFGYNVLGIPLAALGLLNPVIAGAAMAFSSVSVVLNALVLSRWRGVADGRAAQPPHQQPRTVAILGEQR